MVAPRSNASHDANFEPTLIGVSTADGMTPVPVEVDPTTGQLQVSGTGGGGGSSTQYTDGDATITHPIGTIPVFNKAGTITAVSDTNPLPTSATVSTTDIFPATQNITAQDIATSTVAGYNGQTFIIGTPTSNSAATFTLSGIATVNIQMTGVWTGSLRIEASTDGGTVYAGAATVTSNAFLIAAVSGCTHIRIRSIATWTGTATIKITESINDHLTDVLNPIRLLDSTTNALMTIKPASTASVTTDTSVVVGLNPLSNTVTSINSELGDFTGTFTNATQTTSVTATGLDGYGNFLISVHGTYGAATGIFEGSDDSGTTWYTIEAARDDSAVQETGYTSLTNISRTWQINNPGLDSVRVRSSAVASGTVTVRISASAAPGSSGATVAANITDGTNVGNVLKSDGTAAGQNSLIVSPTYLSVAYSTTIAASVASTDAGNYTWVSVHQTTTGGSSTTTFQTSNDNVNWVSQTLITSTSIGGNTSTTAANANLYQGPVMGRYFRLSVTGIVSGTTAGVVVFSTGTRQYNSMSVAASQSGTWTVQPGNTANTTAWKVDGSAVTQPVSQATASSLNATVVGTGTLAVQTTSDVPGTGATNLGKAEDAAHTTGDTGVMALGVRNDTLADTTNTTGDYAQLSTDIKGRVITAGAPRALKGIQQTSVSNTTSETTIITAVASTFLDVYGIILANTGASTTKVTIKDATAGTTRAIIEVPTLETRGFMLPVDSAIPQAAVNTNWTVTCGTATTALEVTAMYVKMI